MQEQIIQQEQAQSGSGKGKVVLIGVGIVGLGTLAFFGWRKWKSIQEEAPTELQEKSDPSTTTSSSPNKSYSAPARNDNFPLKRGSKGERVKKIQRLLVKKGLLDEKDVIGEFGPKTEAGLLKAGLPKVINESTFNTITSDTPKVTIPVSVPDAPIDASTFAEGLYNAARSKNFSAAITMLRLMKSTADYTAVSNIFKTKFLNGVRQTLVNGMLNSFSDPSQKDTLRKAFVAMGLKYDGNKFSLSGLPNRRLITSSNTHVFDHTLCGICVPANVILGVEAGCKGQYTQFINKGRLFLVPTATITYL